MMKAFSLYYVDLLVNRSILKLLYKKKMFVAIEHCAFVIQFEGMIPSCWPNFWEFEAIMKIQMIVSKDELVALIQQQQ